MNFFNLTDFNNISEHIQVLYLTRTYIANSLSHLDRITLILCSPHAAQSCMTACPTALLAPFCITQSPGCNDTKSFNMRYAVGGLT